MDDNESEKDKKEVLRLNESLLNSADPGEPPYCSFCGRGQKEYRALVQGPRVFICDTCVTEAQAIVKKRTEND